MIHVNTIKSIDNPLPEDFCIPTWDLPPRLAPSSPPSKSGAGPFSTFYWASQNILMWVACCVRATVPACAICMD